MGYGRASPLGIRVQPGKERWANKHDYDGISDITRYSV